MQPTRCPRQDPPARELSWLMTHLTESMWPWHAQMLSPQQGRNTAKLMASHVLRRGRSLPKALSKEQLEQVFAQIHHPMDHMLFLVMLRCGLRVSEVVQLKVSDIDWAQQALRIEQGKGRQDRRVYLSADAVASMRACLQRRPDRVPGDYVFWNQKRPSCTLSIKAVQKKMARYAKATGIVASCHSL